MMPVAHLRSRGTTSLAVDCLRERGALQALAPEWRQLLDDSRLSSIFLTWEWQRSWLDHYLSPGDEPLVVTLRDQGRLIAVLPLLRKSERWHGRFPARCIRFLGTGEPEAEEVVSESLDIICLPGREQDAVRAVASHLLSQAAEWDVIYFQDIREDSLIYRELIPLLREQDLRVVQTSEWVNYSFKLPASLKEYIGIQAKKRRTQFNRALRDFKEQKGEFLMLSDAADLDWYYRELIRLHNARWWALGKPGIFTTPRVGSFHNQALRDTLATGRLHLSLLRFGENVVSANYIFRYKGVTQHYQGGFDPSFAGLRSVGTLHTLLSTDRDIQDGCHTLDFMKGPINVASYKHYFGCLAEPLFDVTIFNDNASGKLLSMLHGLRDQMHRIKKRVRRFAEKPASSVADES